MLDKNDLLFATSVLGGVGTSCCHTNMTEKCTIAPYCERLSMDYPVSAAVQCDTIIRSYEEKLATDHPEVGQVGTGAGETLDSNYLIIYGQPFSFL